MHLGNLLGRMVIVQGDSYADIEDTSEGRFGPSASSIYDTWESFRSWADDASHWQNSLRPLPPETIFGPVSPRPRQVFAIGLNYRDHAHEAGLPIPDLPITFTKFASSITGPAPELILPSDSVDWEVELVAIIGREGRHVEVSDAWSYVAGLTVGQDYSERMVQHAGPAPQFSLGKSFPGFGALGPHLVTVDELPLDAGLEITCTIDGELVQNSRTSNLIFDVPYLVSYLSKICTLYPGDLIFTGTPGGVGMGHSPRRFLKDGEIIESTIEGLGTFRQICRRA